MRNKGKKIYCCISFIFAVAVLVLTLALAGQENVAYASTVGGTDTDGLINGQDGSLLGLQDEGTGFSFIYNNENGSMSANVRIVLMMTILSLAPSILIMMTSFTRIVVVLHFVRAALGTQTTPPNQVLVGLALFLTLMIMSPTFTRINEEALKPLDAGEITQEEAVEAAIAPMREFMYEITQRKDVDLLCDIAGVTYEEESEIPTSVLIPSFIMTELRNAFAIGFFIYIPFIVIDMVVASILMSMGMMMLPPAMISMPFKLLLFITVDGWELLFKNIVDGFH